MGIIKTAARELFFALPGIVAFLMAALALAVVYMDELQTRLRDQQTMRWIVAITLILMGGGAFVSDKVQRTDDQKAIVDHIQQTAVDTATNLAPKVAAQTASQVTGQLNKDYGVVISNLYREIGELQSQQQTQVNIAQKQFALNFAVSTELVYAGGYLQLWNRGTSNVYICGQKYDGDTASMFDPFSITPKNGFSLLADLSSIVRRRLGQNAEAHIPLDIYLRTEDQKKHVMHNVIWEIVKDGVVTIHAQTRSYEIVKEWPSN